MLAGTTWPWSGDMRMAATMLAMLLAAGAAAKAPTTVSLFRQFGLFGTWAPDCKADASPDNPHVSVTARKPNLVLEQQSLGPDYETNDYAMLSARRLGGDEIEVEAVFRHGTMAPVRQRIVFRIRDHTRRTMFTAGQGEPPLVKDGIAVAVDKPTPLLEKCR
jgi:hypothetical protein